MSTRLLPTLRVLVRRSTALWLVVSLLVVPLWMLLVWQLATDTRPPVQSMLAAWRAAAACGLFFLGAQLAVAVCDAARHTDALQPGRRRTLANAAVALGSGTVALFIAAAVVLCWFAGPDAWRWALVAEACLAFACGTGVVLAVSQRHFSAAWGLLAPLLAYVSAIAVPFDALVEGGAAWSVYALWVLSWPACGWLVWRLIARRRHPVRAFPTLAKTHQIANGLAVSQVVGIDPLLGNARWLLCAPPPSQNRSLSALLGNLGIGILIWFDLGREGVIFGLVFGGLASWWMVAYQGLREGVRPTLLLIPGHQIRPRLGWMFFVEALRLGAINLWWVALAGIAMAWVRPQAPWMQLVAPTALLLAGGVLCLACLIATWPWTQRPFWRAAAQVATAGTTTAASVLGAAYMYSNVTSADTSWLALSLLAAAAMVALSLMLVWASRGAWARADLHAVFAPSRARTSWEQASG
jgi:hypothetical protein